MSSHDKLLSAQRELLFSLNEVRKTLNIDADFQAKRFLESEHFQLIATAIGDYRVVDVTLDVVCTD